jgi:hypothetical protein
MRTLIIAAGAVAFFATSALAQTTTAPKTPAVATPDTTNPAAPVAGANSFTEAQAKERIEKAGFTNVTDLVKNKDGVWQGNATRGGAKVQVSLDFQGNVVAK